MRKSELIKQNVELFEKSQKYLHLYESEKEKNNQLLKEIENLKDELAALKKMSEPSTAMAKIENKVKRKAELSDDTKFAATIIGKIVVKAAKCCNSLTSSPSDLDPKELVNLILGRTEIAKAEILKTVDSELPFEDKTKLIEDVKKAAEDYFDSIMAQKD